MKLILLILFCGVLASEELLLHFDGQDSTFVDSSGKNHLVSVIGNVTQTSDTSVSGGKSAYFNGSSYLEISEPGFVLASGSDYTIDFWMKSNTTSRMHALSFGAMGTDNIDFDFNDASALWLYHRSYGTNNIMFGTSGQYSNNQWHHVAAVRHNGAVSVYIDGINQGTLNIPSEMNTSSTVYIGTSSLYSSNHIYNWIGYIDELRIVKGEALFTSNFDPNLSIPSSVPEPVNFILLFAGCCLLFSIQRQYSVC